ncbi:pentapeptide repeat-containing protein [Nonomuraea sp. NPDC049152]|uniref:pentapeptide repeat-containing protein n=1 Tax=Nonomuraea sp. NPDC049152 TaxID=3154350 RepID=UPI0033D84287
MLLVGGTVAATMWWLLTGLPSDPPGQAGSARGEAVRTALAAGAGVGAAITLALAFRRQRHQEITTAHTTHDATERRVTDLYTKAAEQLGHDKPAVRLAGLYALERLAQDNPAHRQTIVNVICAYLRMPFTPPKDPDARRLAVSTPGPWLSAPSADPDWAPEGERQVRLTAQTILAEHLRDERRPEQRADLPAPARLWPGMRIDLTGATLIDFNLNNAHLAEARFNRATFVGDASFISAVFTRQAVFEETTFTGEASFYGASFTEGAWFHTAAFIRDADFEEATFTEEALFYGASFTGNARFNEATFADYALFVRVAFAADAQFEDAAFTEFARFDEATFAADSVFNGVVITQFTGSRMDKAEWTEIADDPNHVWPSGWQMEPGPDGSSVLTRPERAEHKETSEAPLPHHPSPPRSQSAGQDSSAHEEESA